ncbi:MAG: hypothetical protein PSV16_00680 [Flavobacterium sp.]|nr:hypothetical protein [Flavobacterium sp.]
MGKEEEKEEEKTEEQKKTEARFKDGYNQGYLISMYDPNIAQIFASVDAQDPFLEGFKAGKKTLEIEKEHEKLPSWSKREISPEFNEVSKPKDKGIEPDR